ncbi:universal stress protein [Fimbriimonas ginsengisoli]|uniref:universal stress protein n=1 Tax=Fimbriimonas ginsengisoli TaxID=1005039 RepID=UPI0003E9624D|nr:universal stress protein [Fimbriimonas ginsengisoli]
MKAVVGIDLNGAYKPAIKLLARFRFEKPESTLAHFVNPVPAYFPMDVVAAGQLQSDYVKALENAGRIALDASKDEACMRDLKPRCTLRFGPAATGLSDIADQTHSDIVAVGAGQGSLWSTSFLGSVSRGLAIGCHASILVSKGPIRDGAPLKVVLATDHSPESERWIRKFLSWHAKGISEIHVVTAYQISDHEAHILQANLPALGGMVDTWIEDHLQSLNDRLVAKLQAAGYVATSRVGAGTANDVIRQAMQDTQADVLVIGAQGHGFAERLFIGSCSMHQVVAEPYPVLVVRS